MVRLADATGAKVEKLPESIGGLTVNLTDPTSGWCGLSPTRARSPAAPADAGVQLRARRAPANGTQRPRREPRGSTTGHVVLQTTTYVETLNWYLEHLGLIVSDFKYYEGQRDAAPR